MMYRRLEQLPSIDPFTFIAWRVEGKTCSMLVGLASFNALRACPYVWVRIEGAPSVSDLRAIRRGVALLRGHNVAAIIERGNERNQRFAEFCGFTYHGPWQEGQDLYLWN